MNQVENLQTWALKQTEIIQQQADEIKRLKGEQGKPKFKPKKPTDHSSEKDRREPKSHHKGSKQAEIKIDRVEIRKANTSKLPADAVFKGYKSSGARPRLAH